MKPHLLVAILLVVVALSGCSDGGKPELTVFRVDEIRYWFEGEDRIVVNVTITNQVNFTPSGIFPELSVAVEEWTPRPGTSHQVGKDTTRTSYRSFSLAFVPDTPTSRQSEGRWVHDERVRFDGAFASAQNGPIRILPGMSISREFEFPASELREDDGFYVIVVRTKASFPEDSYSEYNKKPWGRYYTGCFNHDVAEFYGVGTGLDCYHWDCTGLSTNSGYTTHRGIKESHKPICNATNATGPDYSL